VPAALDVLEQATAEGYVEELVSAADRQDGEVGAKGRIEEGELELVALRVDTADPFVALGAVANGVHVDAAGKNQAATNVECGTGGGAVEVERFQARLAHAFPVTFDGLTGNVFPARDRDAALHI